MMIKAPMFLIRMIHSINALLQLFFGPQCVDCKNYFTYFPFIPTYLLTPRDLLLRITL